MILIRRVAIQPSGAGGYLREGWVTMTAHSVRGRSWGDLLQPPFITIFGWLDQRVDHYLDTVEVVGANPSPLITPFPTGDGD